MDATDLAHCDPNADYYTSYLSSIQVCYIRDRCALGFRVSSMSDRKANRRFVLFEITEQYPLGEPLRYCAYTIVLLISRSLGDPSGSYQTPSGVVTGIQWVPAEATHLLPTGAQPANAVGVVIVQLKIYADRTDLVLKDFAASWNRGHLTREDEKALKHW